MHLLVDGKQQEARSYNMFRIHKIDGVNIDGTFLQVRPSERAGYNLLTIIGGSKYSDWQQWHETQTGKRGEDYQQVKMEAARSLIEIAGSVLGALGDYTILDISTPLTMRDWAASPEGSMYGLMRSVTNDLQYAVLTRMPLTVILSGRSKCHCPGASRGDAECPARCRRNRRSGQVSEVSCCKA